MTFRQTDCPAVSATKAAISTATAYRFEQDHRPPSSQKQVRGRRRPDPLADFFDTEVVPMLTAAPGLRAVAGPNCELRPVGHFPVVDISSAF